jgi:hypothetical protein
MRKKMDGIRPVVDRQSHQTVDVSSILASCQVDPLTRHAILDTIEYGVKTTLSELLMFDVKVKIDRTLIITVANPTKLVKGHPIKRGAGSHTDKRHRRTDRKSRNQSAIKEFA